MSTEKQAISESILNLPLGELLRITSGYLYKMSDLATQKILFTREEVLSLLREDNDLLQEVTTNILLVQSLADIAMLWHDKQPTAFAPQNLGQDGMDLFFDLENDRAADEGKPFPLKKALFFSELVATPNTRLVRLLAYRKKMGC